MSKTVNYTPEQVKMLVESYTAATTDGARGEVVRDMAGTFGKSTRSIVAKLSREGVYVKPASDGKKGGVKKGQVANAIGVVVRLSENEVSSLEKANMTALVKLWNFLVSKSDQAEADKA